VQKTVSPLWWAGDARRTRFDFCHQSREGSYVSYSFHEPDWLDVCECKYDEARDEMDRDDCPFHSGLENTLPADRKQTLTRKGQLRLGGVKEPAA
jgi:hypothetical protein